MTLMRRAAALTCSVLAVAGVSGATAAASAPELSHRLIMPFSANKSQNWSGYNQGSQALGGVLFHEVAGDWTVPTPSQHRAGEAEYSSDWVGIGGGCVDAGCTVGDNTLIQTGTEQDVSSGSASYGAWWELIPGPSIAITNLTVQPGDHMHADISEVVAGANLWKITLQNVTRGQTFTTTVPYAST